MGGDLVRGGSGNDILRGNDGVDLIYGDAGDDYLYGDKGDASGSQLGQARKAAMLRALRLRGQST
ncbi:MAG: hypothetical protein U1D30_13875 [Planctomycetota bacterium]